MELQHCEHWRCLCAGTPGVKCWLSFIIFAHFKEALLSTCNFEKFTLSIFKVVKFFFFFDIETELKGFIGTIGKLDILVVFNVPFVGPQTN